MNLFALLAHSLISDDSISHAFVSHHLFILPFHNKKRHSNFAGASEYLQKSFRKESDGFFPNTALARHDKEYPDNGIMAVKG